MIIYIGNKSDKTSKIVNVTTFSFLENLFIHSFYFINTNATHTFSDDDTSPTTTKKKEM